MRLNVYKYICIQNQSNTITSLRENKCENKTYDIRVICKHVGKNVFDHFGLFNFNSMPLYFKKRIFNNANDKAN